ncbi:MAG: hypothetical protein JXR70_05510 [Spirochaetales bacterium]|nr:hypothetical protein [Spirochaetales bacterium]
MNIVNANEHSRQIVNPNEHSRQIVNPNEDSRHRAATRSVYDQAQDAWPSSKRGAFTTRPVVSSQNDKWLKHYSFNAIALGWGLIILDSFIQSLYSFLKRRIIE